MNLNIYFNQNIFILFYLTISLGLAHSEDNVIHLTEANWTKILNGEWMIKFHAPWCPACQSLEPTWKKFSTLVANHEIKVAEVDITQNPSVTGIFFITALPTIYHAKNSEFRIYKSVRSEDALEEFVRNNQYASLEPVPWIYSPSSFHMYIFGQFIRFCVMIKDLHSWLVETVGVPSWVSYLSMGVITLIFGLLFGLLLICCCDLICPPRPQASNVLFGRELNRPMPEFDADNDTEPDVLEDNSKTGEDPLDGAGDKDDNEEDGENTDEESSVRQRKS